MESIPYIVGDSSSERLDIFLEETRYATNKAFYSVELNKCSFLELLIIIPWSEIIFQDNESGGGFKDASQSVFGDFKLWESRSH